MRNNRLYVGLLAVLSLTLLLGAAPDDEQQGCGGGLDNRPGEKGIDVGGPGGADWEMTYGDQVQVRVLKGGVAVATKNFAWATGGKFDVDGETVDLRKFCDRGDIACPEEVFPKKVRMTQPGANLHLLYVTFNPTGPLKDIKEATLLGNVDSDFDFSIFLGVGAAGAGSCGLLSTSYATGKITGTPAVPPKGTNFGGKIVTTYTGGCALLGTAAGAGAGLQVELTIPISGVRL